MKRQITKGKVIQSCLKVLAAVVVAGGVGFQYIENQELDKELATLNQVQKETVQTLEDITKENTAIQDQYGVLAQNADKLLNQVTALEKEKATLKADKAKLEKAKKSLQDDKKALQNQKENLQQKNNTLDRQLEEEKNRPRKLSAAPSTTKTAQKASAPVTSAPKAETAKAVATPKVTKAPTVQTASAKAAPKASPAKAPIQKAQSVGKTVNGSATAYNANCEGCSGITASGKTVGPGMIAMASWVPLGTKVRITCNSYPSINGVYTVEDRGGAIQGNKVDIFVHTYEQAIDFGRRDITIEILN